VSAPRGMRARVAVIVVIAAALAAGCGEDDFARNPRPPVPVELTGVIQDDAVTVSPSRLGAGPIQITISNQTDRRQTVTLEGERLETRAGPVDPLDTATINRTLEPGIYEVRAGSAVAAPREIKPATLQIGRERANSNDVLLLP
jgi:hypothetical protein